jgi:hypothetical protein
MASFGSSPGSTTTTSVRGLAVRGLDSYRPADKSVYGGRLSIGAAARFNSSRESHLVGALTNR